MCTPNVLYLQNKKIQLGITNYNCCKHVCISKIGPRPHEFTCDSAHLYKTKRRKIYPQTNKRNAMQQHTFKKTISPTSPPPRNSCTYNNHSTIYNKKVSVTCITKSQIINKETTKLIVIVIHKKN